MNIENQVCSLEQAKKLKELGIEQKSYFRYSCLLGNDYCLTFGEHVNTDDYSAFTVAELGVMLGRYARNTSSLSDDGNEAIDRADDLIHLIEMGETSVELCNDDLEKP